MRPVATDGVAWSVCVYVCLLVTFVIPAKSAEPIEMPSVGLSLVGPRNPVLNGVEIPLREGAIFGVARPIEKHLESRAAVYAAKGTIQSFITVRNAMRPFVKIV